MFDWEIAIFLNAINIQVAEGEGTPEEIVKSYTKLTEDEQNELLNKINNTIN